MKNQLLGDSDARLVKLVGAVGRFTEQDKMFLCELP